ncbi:MAG: hypothetical protein IK115_05345 [Lachnospiraceae bacterium]|nr:hypothetical protein [Lachnospiraceae bacterium]
MKYKYDKRIRRRLFVASVSLACLAFISALLLLAESLAPYAYLLLVFLIPVDICCWAGWVDSLQYIRRLGKWGIEVPEVKGDQLIPPPLATELPEDGEVCTHSVILAGLAWAVCAGIVIWAFLHVRHFAPLGIGADARFAAAIFGVPLFAAWMIGGLVYFRQRLNSLYRDEADPLTFKKVRTRFVSGCVTISICLLITCFLLHSARTMSDYIYKSRLQAVWEDDWRSHVGEPLP